MASHFAYKTPCKINLSQGDILQINPNIKEILASIHPYYLRPNYTHLIVLTQSCDLVKGQGGKPCKSKYINLGAVRPLSTVLEREVLKFQEDEIDRKGGFVDSKNKTYLENFVSKLLNNNDSEHFYLHPDPSFNFVEPKVAFLRLSIAIKSMHYDTCLNAKILELEDNFKSKLGWLVGNLYSRIGTEDWIPNHKNEADFRNMVKDVLETHCVWVDRMKQVKKELKRLYTDQEIQDMGEDTLQKEIKDIRLPTNSDLVKEAIENILSKKISDPDTVRKIVVTIFNDPVIKRIIE